MKTFINQFLFSLLSLTLLGGAIITPPVSTLANKQGGAQTRLPNTLKEGAPDSKNSKPRLLASKASPAYRSYRYKRNGKGSKYAPRFDAEMMA